MSLYEWPDVPKLRTQPCDLCPEDAEPGSALCGKCADETLRKESEE